MHLSQLSNVAVCLAIARGLLGVFALHLHWTNQEVNTGLLHNDKIKTIIPMRKVNTPSSFRKESSHM